MSSLKKNIGYQTFYQILTTILPLITSPYLARVLGANKLGFFSYTQSIANYFVLFAALGVINYGTRTIASCKNDKEKRSITFFEIYFFQLFTSLFALVIYILFICLIIKNNIIIYFAQGLLILSTLLDINWLFFGMEDFKVTVTRNVIIKILTVIAILLFVKNQQDLLIYVIIMSGGTIISNMLLFYFVPKIVDVNMIKKISILGILKHFKPNLLLFIPLLAMSVYHIMDKTMLGALSTYEQTGFYYNADKIINIPIGIINGIGTVMLPRATSMIEAKKTSQFNKLFNTTIELVILVSCAMAFGIASISYEFTPFFFGKGFEPCIMLIIFLSPVLIIKSISNTSRMQYLIPSHKEKIFIQSVFIGAIVNLVINWCIIPSLGAFGAVIGTVVAEFVTCLWQYIKMSKFINCKTAFIKSIPYIFFGLIMFLIVRLFSSSFQIFNISYFISIIVEIIIGGIIYIISCVAYWKITKNNNIDLFIKKIR